MQNLDELFDELSTKMNFIDADGNTAYPVVSGFRRIEKEVGRFARIYDVIWNRIKYPLIITAILLSYFTGSGLVF